MNTPNKISRTSRSLLFKRDKLRTLSNKQDKSYSRTVRIHNIHAAEGNNAVWATAESFKIVDGNFKTIDEGMTDLDESVSKLSQIISEISRVINNSVRALNEEIGDD